MTNNQDALRCAGWCDEHSSGAYRTSAEAAAHIRRLVEDNEAKDALLRQAWAVIRGQCFGECRTEGVDGLPTPSEVDTAIREHLNK